MGWRYNQNVIADITPERGLDMSTAKSGRRPSPRLCHTGGEPAIATTSGNNSTPDITEVYLCEVFVPATCLVTGIAVFNGSDVTGSLKVGLFDSAGTLLRASAAAGTAGSGTDAYQLIPFALNGANVAATTIELPGPATYYVGVTYSSATARYNAHAVGTFGAGKVTSTVFATAFSTTTLTVTPPTTFTANLGNIASLY